MYKLFFFNNFLDVQTYTTTFVLCYTIVSIIYLSTLLYFKINIKFCSSFTFLFKKKFINLFTKTLLDMYPLGRNSLGISLPFPSYNFSNDNNFSYPFSFFLVVLAEERLITLCRQYLIPDFGYHT